ncbi:MAG TPA: TetR/AcrR family transcriptional regulator, partial [Beutenbergiaceae bacterium]|nr:TetR/AcrR family transcriptional regulator [Beutenbergiaceae bacterium]
LFEAAHGIVADAGFASASVKAIAEAAGVSAGTVYTYFGSREELLVQVFRAAAGRELDQVRRAVAAAGEEPGSGRAQREISALVGTFAPRALAGRTLAWALLIEPAGERIDAERLTHRRAYAREMEAIVTRGIAAGELPQQDPRIVGPGLIGLISEALTGPLSPEGAVPAEHLITAVIDMCLRAVGGTP